MARADTLTANKARFVACMLTARTIEQAGELAGVSLRTARRYAADPTVRAALTAALDDGLRLATRDAVGAMTSALATLEEIHTDKSATTGARVSAARAILEAGPRLREAFDLAARVAALEEAKE